VLSHPSAPPGRSKPSHQACPRPLDSRDPIIQVRPDPLPDEIPRFLRLHQSLIRVRPGQISQRVSFACDHSAVVAYDSAVTLTLESLLDRPQREAHVGLDKYLQHERAVSVSGEDGFEEPGGGQAAMCQERTIRTRRWGRAGSPRGGGSTKLIIPLIVRNVVAQLCDVRVEGR
jgi:hypothetical protein